MKAILTAALLCECSARRAAVIDHFCRGDANSKKRLLARLVAS